MTLIRTIPASRKGHPLKSPAPAIATLAASPRPAAPATDRATGRHAARARAVHRPAPGALAVVGAPKGEQAMKNEGIVSSGKSTPNWRERIRRLATLGRHDTYCAGLIAHALRYDYPGLEVTAAEVAAEAERCGLRLLASPSASREVTP